VKNCVGTECNSSMVKSVYGTSRKFSIVETRPKTGIANTKVNSPKTINVCLSNNNLESKSMIKF
jgi:hypothetical protein